VSSVVGRLAAELRTHGTALHVQPLGPSSENLIEVLGGETGGRTLLVTAHVDTVPEGEPGSWFGGQPRSGRLGEAEVLPGDEVLLTTSDGMARVGLRPRMREVWRCQARDRRSVVYGRGAFDNKGAVVSLTLAMRCLATSLDELGMRLGGDLLAAYTADEETDATGIARLATVADSWLAGNRHLPDRAGAGMRPGIEAVVLEGSFGWAPVVGHRGGIHLGITVRGAATHASTPDLGTNAVVGMAEVIGCLERARHRPGGLLGIPQHPLLGPESAAIGTTIVGGGVRAVERSAEGTRVERAGLNVVPDWCETTIDIRFPPLEGVADVPAAIAGRVRDLIGEELPGRPWTVEVRVLRDTFMPAVAMGADAASAAEHPLVRSARHAATEVLGADPGIAVAPGGSDATYLVHDAGIPTLVEIGPSGGRSHDVHEFVDAQDVLDGARILARVAIDRLGVRPAG
jgi:acetylornithine deacetylase/succinyl-diaminopimelate desuccinylase-like protein